jgi:hypothetical protein
VEKKPEVPNMILNGADMLRLWKYCEQFIKKQNVNCPEAVYQSDNVVLNSYEFIEGVCEIVGYYDEEHDKFSKNR